MNQENFNILENISSEDENTQESYDITTYGADYTVEGLVSKIHKESIFVPNFQRKYVWNKTDASKFIESLLIGLPVPGVFLAKDNKTGRLLIVDGQQRLMSLYYFYQGKYKDDSIFKLKKVKNEFLNKTYEDLSKLDKLTLDNAIIHSVIIKDFSNENDAIFQIFERLNTRGKTLKPHEIRNCVFHGKFIELLDTLIENPAWRSIFGENINNRSREQELILRFFALHFNLENYKNPLKSFLNDFTKLNRDFEEYNKKEITKIFEQTITFIFDNIGEKSFKPKKQINAAVFDAVMVGVSQNMNHKIKNFKEKYEKLLKEPNFTKAILERTTNVVNLKSRINLAIKTFK